MHFDGIVFVKDKSVDLVLEDHQDKFDYYEISSTPIDTDKLSCYIDLDGRWHNLNRKSESNLEQYMKDIKNEAKEISIYKINFHFYYTNEHRNNK